MAQMIESAVSGQMVYTNPLSWQDYGGMWHNVIPVYQYDVLTGQKYATDISTPDILPPEVTGKNGTNGTSSLMLPLLIVGAVALFMMRGKML